MITSKYVIISLLFSFLISFIGFLFDGSFLFKYSNFLL